MRRKWSLPTVVMMVALLAGSLSATYPQSPGGNCEYFGETGHYVCGEFLEFYKTRGGLEIFGYPLTEAFEDPARGLQVQYFQRARMEWHPQNSASQRLQLGLLVDELGYRFPAARPNQIPSFNTALQQYFPETGHIVSYAFLKYFREKGGVGIFGYPRSEFMYEDGYIVQYFQRARMEWHPEDRSGPRMRLTNIGEIYIERFGLPGDYDESLPPPGRPGEASAASPELTVTKLHISASVRYIITGRKGSQTVFVYATDQRQRPIQDVAVKMVVHYQSGDQRYGFEATNARGFTSQSFDILPAPAGRKVIVDVTATYGDLTSTTQTFFLPWW